MNTNLFKYQFLEFLNQPSVLINSDGLIVSANKKFIELFETNSNLQLNLIELLKKKVNF